MNECGASAKTWRGLCISCPKRVTEAAENETV